MKRLLCLLSCASIIFLFNSCGKTDFDSSLLPGKWKEGQYYERYFNDGTGYSWDEADNVSESEAQKFTWKLSKADLTQYHQMEISSAIIPKSYTLTELTSSSLKYKDDYGVSHSFTRVN